MLDESRFAPLINVFEKLDVFLGRRPVQIQLLTLIIVIVVSLLVARAFWIWALPRSLRWALSIRRAFFRRTVVFVLRLADAISFPLLSLLLLEPARIFLDRQEILGGLLQKFTWILVTLIVFRILRTVLYATLEVEKARRYHHRFLIPLFLALIVLGTLDNLTDMSRVREIVLATPFSTTLKLGPVFFATFGLYFFASGLSLAEELIHRFIAKQTRLDSGRSKATLTLTRYILLIAGLIAALSQFELEPAIVAAITGGLSIGVGFGLREILSNFISGFLLLFERSLNPGDVIEMDNQLSMVEKLSVRATTVRTLNNEELVIPNQTFLTSSFKTYTGTDRTVRLPILMQTDCHIDPGKVCDLLAATAAEHDSVLSEPEPTVFLMEYANNVATFQLNIWLANPLDGPGVQSEIKLHIWDAFKAHNIDLPFPEMDLHFPKRVPVEAAISNPDSN